MLALFLISKILSLEQFQNDEGNKLVLQQVQGLSFELKTLFSLHPMLMTIVFCFSFFIVTILYLPFTGVIYALFAGALFGFYTGVVLFSFLVSISYTASYLISKHFFYNFIRSHMGKRGRSIIAEFEKDGVVYLLSLRLTGVVPGVLFNAVMGITRVSVAKFYITTQIGTLPHVITVVYAGSQLLNIVDINSLVSNNFFILIILLSLMPIAVKIMVQQILKGRKIEG